MITSRTPLSWTHVGHFLDASWSILAGALSKRDPIPRKLCTLAGHFLDAWTRHGHFKTRRKEKRLGQATGTVPLRGSFRQDRRNLQLLNYESFLPLAAYNPSKSATSRSCLLWFDNRSTISSLQMAHDKEKCGLICLLFVPWS